VEGTKNAFISQISKLAKSDVTPHVQHALEHAGYRLSGFFRDYDREEIAPGVVKRGYEAVYAKLLVSEDEVQRPDPKNMTPKTKALFDLLFPA
jgi:hypothetical protein